MIARGGHIPIAGGRDQHSYLMCVGGNQSDADRPCLPIGREFPPAEGGAAASACDTLPLAYGSRAGGAQLAPDAESANQRPLVMFAGARRAPDLNSS